MDEVVHKPGWDSKAIRDIAHRVYGGYEQMFIAHGWEERGSGMIQKVQTRVKETYGSVKAFVAKSATH